MRRVWSWMAINFSKHAGIVGAVGLAITLLMGLGITKLEFATGQDSYLNKDEQVYKDSVAYQSLFGGQAMLTLFTMDEGKTVADWFTPENIEHMTQVEEELRNTDGVLTVISPLTALEFTQAMVTGPPEAPTTSPRAWPGQALLAARDAEPDPEAQAVRLEDAGHPHPHQRGPGPPTFDNPSGSTSCCSTTRARSASPCGPSSRTRTTPSPSPGWSATPLRSRARPASGSWPRSRPSRSRTPRPSPPAPRSCSRT